MSDIPDWTTYVVPVSVTVPATPIQGTDIAEYDDAPEDLEDGARGPIYVDIKGRVWVRVYSGTIEVEQSDPADLKATVTQASIERTVDHTKIKGGALKDPTVASSIPISIENDAIAYDAVDDVFKIALYYSAAEIDPRSIRALTNADVVTVEQDTAASLKATVTQADKTDFEAIQDTPGDLLIRVYGNTVKDGSGTDYALLVDSDGKLSIRPLTSADVVTVADVTKTAPQGTGEATASGNTEIVTVTAGKKLRIKAIDIWNNGTEALTVALRLTSTGTLTYKKKIAEESGWIINLIGCNWEGGTNEDLFINLSAEGTVSYTISYTEED